MNKIIPDDWGNYKQESFKKTGIIVKMTLKAELPI
jgi:hypothetical protein